MVDSNEWEPVGVTQGACCRIAGTDRRVLQRSLRVVTYVRSSSSSHYHQPFGGCRKRRYRQLLGFHPKHKGLSLERRAVLLRPSATHVRLTLTTCL